jgi:hypothetical protein
MLAGRLCPLRCAKVLTFSSVSSNRRRCPHGRRYFSTFTAFSACFSSSSTSFYSSTKVRSSHVTQWQRTAPAGTSFPWPTRPVGRALYEALILCAYIVIEAARLFIGSAGNRSQQFKFMVRLAGLARGSGAELSPVAGAQVVFVLLSAFTVVMHVFYLDWQMYMYVLARHGVAAHASRTLCARSGRARGTLCWVGSRIR